jgi:hypothetical protein
MPPHFGQLPAGLLSERVIEFCSVSGREESTGGRGENSLIDPSERRLHPGR